VGCLEGLMLVKPSSKHSELNSVEENKLEMPHLVIQYLIGKICCLKNIRTAQWELRCKLNQMN